MTETLPALERRNFLRVMAAAAAVIFVSVLLLPRTGAVTRRPATAAAE